MNHNIIKTLQIIFAVGILFFNGACTDDFEALNENPSTPSNTDAEYLFNYVIKEGAGEYGIVTNYNYNYLQRWVMQTAAVWGNSTMPPYTLFDQYRIGLLWEHFYADLLLNIEVILNKTENDPQAANNYNVARIWKVYNFHKVTDLWGSVPYTEAWQVLEGYSSAAIHPKYDSQELIYQDMLNELKDAASKLDNSMPFFSNDNIYDGNLENWKKFANSLRLRLAIRSGNQDIVNEIISEDNLISSNAENATFEYINDQNWWNPYYELHIGSRNPSNPDLTGTSVIKISELMKLHLESTNDPRLEIYAQTIELDNSTYRGVPNLMDANKKENQALGMGVTSTSYIGKFYSRNPTWNKPLLTYAEVCFLRAEAALREWTSENAQEWYEKGLRAGLEYYNIPENEIEAVITTGAPFNNSLEQIITQKWVALFLDGWETFAEYRRTGYPQLKKYDLELDGVRILNFEWVNVPRNYVPGRLQYPDSEIDLNNTNYKEAVESGGGDTYFQQLWWSQKFGDINY